MDNLFLFIIWALTIYGAASVVCDIQIALYNWKQKKHLEQMREQLKEREREVAAEWAARDKKFSDRHKAIQEIINELQEYDKNHN